MSVKCWPLIVVFLLLVSTHSRSQEVVLQFGVISDTHFGNSIGEGPMNKVPRALSSITSYGALDALFVVGDLTNNGKREQYEQLVSVFGDSSVYEDNVRSLYFMMGNHDHYDDRGIENYSEYLRPFNNGESYPLHQYFSINGYPFITISMLAKIGVESYPEALADTLGCFLARAAKEYPEKPIFVFTHVPPEHTVYGTWPEYENGVVWCSPLLNRTLNKYPQVVLFSGHSHYPIGDPRSIHQGVSQSSANENYYTVVNTGSTTYVDVHRYPTYEGKYPPGYENITEGLIVYVYEDKSVEIRRYDTYKNEEIASKDRWTLYLPYDGSMFTYADIRDYDDCLNSKKRDGTPGPDFDYETEIKLEFINNRVIISFPQAEDNNCVFRYRVMIKEVSGNEVYDGYISSQFYKNSEMPSSLSCLSPLLDTTKDYCIEITALDSFDNESETLKCVASFQNTTENMTGISDVRKNNKFLKSYELNGRVRRVDFDNRGIVITEGMKFLMTSH